MIQTAGMWLGESLISMVCGLLPLTSAGVYADRYQRLVSRATTRQPGAQTSQRERRLVSHRKILGAGVQHNNRTGGLLRMQLELVGQFDADAIGLEQRQDLRLILQPGTGGIAE